MRHGCGKNTVYACVTFLKTKLRPPKRKLIVRCYIKTFLKVSANICVVEESGPLNALLGQSKVKQSRTFSKVSAL